MSISQSKFDAAYKGLTGIARKVYDATPNVVAWAGRDIHKEMWRTAGGTGGSDYRVVIGCLSGLVESGLVLEKQTGHFLRTPIREKIKAVKVEQPTPQEQPPMNVTAIKQPVTTTTAATTTQPVVIDPIDRLAKLSSRVTALTAALNEIAADIDAAALDIASHIERSNADSADLFQLRTLLKKFA